MHLVGMCSKQTVGKALQQVHEVKNVSVLACSPGGEKRMTPVEALTKRARR